MKTSATGRLYAGLKSKWSLNSDSEDLMISQIQIHDQKKKANTPDRATKRIVLKFKCATFTIINFEL